VLKNYPTHLVVKILGIFIRNEQFSFIESIFRDELGPQIFFHDIRVYHMTNKTYTIYLMTKTQKNNWLALEEGY
jgi:hypothetical protein